VCTGFEPLDVPANFHQFFSWEGTDTHAPINPIPVGKWRKFIVTPKVSIPVHAHKILLISYWVSLQVNILRKFSFISKEWNPLHVYTYMKPFLKFVLTVLFQCVILPQSFYVFQESILGLFNIRIMTLISISQFSEYFPWFLLFFVINTWLFECFHSVNYVSAFITSTILTT
jgi:hypothetical protein